MKTLLVSLPLCIALLSLPALAAETPPLVLQAAAASAHAQAAPMLGATLAGQRIVAVGDHGLVILSDDHGKTFRQARSVPVSSTLTGVSFADTQHGWAVGHWGVILHTADGGDTWRLQRSDAQEDRPLFAVHFFDTREGIAVGLWSQVLATRDGGASWQALTLPAPPDGGRADRNLLAAFADAGGNLYVPAERGMVLHTADRGRRWRYLDTGYAGSFWTGAALRGGELLVAGLRGSVFRSTDGGARWHAVDSGARSSITGMVESAERTVQAVGLDGTMLKSTDGGASFKARQRDDRLSLTTLVAASGDVVRFSKRGVIDAGKP